MKPLYAHMHMYIYTCMNVHGGDLNMYACHVWEVIKCVCVCVCVCRGLEACTHVPGCNQTGIVIMYKRECGNVHEHNHLCKV